MAGGSLKPRWSQKAKSPLLCLRRKSAFLKNVVRDLGFEPTTDNVITVMLNW